MEKFFGILSGLFLIISQIAYIKSVVQKKIAPNVLSWFGWSFIIGSAWFAQIIEKGFEWSAVGIFLSFIGCMFIALAGFISKNYIIEKKDWIFLSLGLACFFVYQLSKDPWITTIFAIAADFALAIPMLNKAVRVKKSEDSTAWYFSGVAWLIATILSLFDEMIYRLFPIYLLSFSLFMIWLMHRKESKN